MPTVIAFKGNSKVSYSVELEDVESEMGVHMRLVLEELAVLDNFETLMDLACQLQPEMNDTKLKPEMNDTKPTEIVENDPEIIPDVATESCLEIVNKTTTAATTKTRVDPITEPRVPLWRPNYPENMPGCCVLESAISQVH